MRKKKALYNLISSFLMQLILVLVNFIIPKLIIKNYGSSINGLINSITQFLSYISLLESGVASVIQAKYYKTLAENDTQTQSQIYKESSRFFKCIGYIAIFYLNFQALTSFIKSPIKFKHSKIVLLNKVKSLSLFK